MDGCRRLKLNHSKNRIIYCGSRQWLTKCQEKTIKMVQEEIQLCNMVCYLGCYLDSTLSFTDHVRTKYKAAIINIIQIRNIKYLNRATMHTFIKSLVISHLDYSNSILAGIPNKTLRIMQGIQNTAASVVLSKESYNTKYYRMPKTLHWLPIKERINYKIFNLVHKSLHG